MGEVDLDSGKETAVFPGGGGTPDMNQLLQQAQQMQESLVSAQQELAEAEVTGTAGGDLVTATVNGVGELQSLDIKSEACDPSDTESLADLIVAAVHDASSNAQRMAADKLGPLSQGMGGLPGMPGGGGPGAPGGPGGGPSGGPSLPGAGA